MSRDRRDYDEYDEDDRPRRREGQPTGLDAFFLNQMVLAVILAICCNGIALILSIIELATGKDPQAKKNATIVLIISGILTVGGCIYGIVSGAMSGGAGAGGFR
jgi:hypothetical protein